MQHASLLAIPILLVLEAAVSVERWAHEMLALLSVWSRPAPDASPRPD